jgi:hypothetical protein
VIERRISSSGGGGGSAGPGQRPIISAFEVNKVRAASVETALGRWTYAVKVPPSAFDHRSWPAVFASLKAAPKSMPASRRYHFAGRILEDTRDSESRRTLAVINDPPIELTGMSASWDAATVHKQPAVVWAGLLPRISKVLLVYFTYLAKTITLEGSKVASVETAG